ncbi:MAG: hypothetical protein Q4G59_11390 [Planctomycetia bacterium]|nr:hypothetical protein [Planctomycetia bacterium]
MPIKFTQNLCGFNWQSDAFIAATFSNYIKIFPRLLVESKNAVARFAAELSGLAALREINSSF